MLGFVVDGFKGDAVRALGEVELLGIPVLIFGIIVIECLTVTAVDMTSSGGRRKFSITADITEGTFHRTGGIVSEDDFRFHGILF